MSNYCMNCGEAVSEWRDGTMVYFDDGADRVNEGTLSIVVCPYCDHQQIDVSGQYGDLPVEDNDEADE